MCFRILVLTLVLLLPCRTAFCEDVGEKNRTWRHVEFAFGITGVALASAGADRDVLGNAPGRGFAASVDLELSSTAFERGTIYAHFEAGRGAGIDERIATLSGFNDDADGEDNLRLTELWYEQSLAGGRLALKLGKLDLTVPCGPHGFAFDANAVANDETSQFVSTGFVNSLAIEFPDNTFGAQLWIAPHERLDLGMAVAAADSDTFEDIFTIVQADLSLTLLGRKGHYRAYMWNNGTSHQVVGEEATTGEDGHGFGVSLDSGTVGPAAAFFRYGWQRGDIYHVEHSWSVGLHTSMGAIGRDDDVFGLAYGNAVISKDWRDVDALSGVATGNEHHVEAYYNAGVNRNLSLSPDVQWVVNPNGDNHNNGVFVFGARVQVAF